MPLPKPEENETKQEFMERCISDEVIQEEFDDMEQRNAVCLVQWEEAQETN